MESTNNESEVTSVTNTEYITTPEKQNYELGCLDAVVMVLETHASPNYTTPLRCKDFYSSSNTVCRICHEEDSPERLISPCDCSGSLGQMHKHCLEKWLSLSNADTCEICKFKFHIIYHPKPFWKWLTTGGFFGPKGFLGDIICLLLLLPLSLISVYLCGFGAQKYMYQHEWEATGLAMLCFFLLIAFSLWCGVTFRFHYRMFRDWQKQNLNIEVVVYSKRSSHRIEMNNNNHQNREGGDEPNTENPRNDAINEGAEMESPTEHSCGLSFIETEL